MGRSSRSRRSVALTLLLVAAVGASLSAHRRDEYLQAARIAIEPDRVRIELELTPGISVAESVLADIDRDGDGSFSPAEQKAYVGRVIGALSLDVDGAALAPSVTGAAFPSSGAIRDGEGIIQIQLTAPLDPRASGAHRFHLRNAYRPDIGAYLANALVPASERVAITGQTRDVDQRNVDVDYVVTNPTHDYRGVRLLLSGVLAALLIGLTGIGCVRTLQ